MNRRFALIPIAAAAVATILFFVQGGFGGGHGDLDPAIVALGVPASVLMPWIPLPEWMAASDLLQVVWLPAVVNCALWAAVITVAGSRIRHRAAAP